MTEAKQGRAASAAPGAGGALRRWVIADAHVGQRPGDDREMSALVLRAVEEGVGEIIYLGDAFRYLVGMEKLWTRAVRTVLRAWDEARAKGLRVVLVEGNRDFFLDDPDLAERRDVSCLVYDFVAGGSRFRCVHGDRVNQRDFNYRFWRAVSKSRASRSMARLLPRRIARRLVAGMEARLATTNKQFRYVKPVEALEREAREAWGQGVDVLLWGHFHTPWETARESHRALVVPAWLETGTVLTIEPDGRWSLEAARDTV